jgi:hypothetical protein
LLSGTHLLLSGLILLLLVPRLRQLIAARFSPSVTPVTA